MPIKIKSKAVPPPREGSPVPARADFDLPDIDKEDSFRDVVKKLSM
jgi:hypothetical protein